LRRALEAPRPSNETLRFDVADCLGVKLGVGPSAFYVGDYAYLLDSMKRLLQYLETSTG
jgi:hypothetical protein